MLPLVDNLNIRGAGRFFFYGAPPFDELYMDLFSYLEKLESDDDDNGDNTEFPEDETEGSHGVDGSHTDTVSQQ